jgi:L-2-hydroxycarboxylate dehydrogenase (NAD+)
MLNARLFHSASSIQKMANISVEQARRLSKSALTRTGIDSREVDIITDILVEAEILGRPTHGLIRLPGIVSRARDQMDARIQVVREDGHYALVNAGGKFGYIAAYCAMEMAIEKAREHGLALIGVKNTGHSGMLGYYARMALRNDFIGMVICNTRPMVAAWGGIEAVFGTNPIAVAIPSDGTPLVLDMSTSSVTFGDLLVASREGKELPEGGALDSTGQPTTDPEKARGGVFLPFGGYKGFGLGLVIQIMAGALVDAEILKTDGILLMAIDPGIFLPVEEFRKQVSLYLDFVKGSRKADGVSEILIPGERSERYKQKCMERGISVDDDLLEQLRRLANPGK